MADASLMSNPDIPAHTNYTAMSSAETTPQNNANGGAAAAASPGSPVPGSPAGPKFASKLILAIVNPLSGERSAAEGLTTSLLTILGEQRVLKLSPVVFRDSTPIATRISDGIKRIAANYPPEALDGSSPDKRMSVVVAGGDGTVSFIIGVLDNLVADPNSGLHGISPAIMVVPMGTGNDLGNSMGYGLGFQTNKLSCCCYCCPNDIEEMLRTGLSARVVPFDRWNSTIYRVDNRSGQQVVEAARGSKMNVAQLLQAQLEQRRAGAEAGMTHNTAASGCYSSTAEWERAEQQRKDAQAAGGANSGDDNAANVSPTKRFGVDVSDSTAINFTALASYDFNNYFSFGLDAAIANDFDDKRKKYPSCHTYRTMNKAWYGYHGLAMSLVATPFSNKRVSICCDKNPVALSSSQDGCRAFVISNIASYSGGVDLWHVDKTGVFKQTAPVVGAPTLDRTTERDVTYSPNSVSDGMLEAVSIGGFFHLGFLRMGMHGDKIAQGGEMCFCLGDLVADGGLQGKTVTFQVDGEPAGQFTYDPGCIVVHVKLQSRCYFHKVN